MGRRLSELQGLGEDLSGMHSEYSSLASAPTRTVSWKKSRGGARQTPLEWRALWLMPTGWQVF